MNLFPNQTGFWNSVLKIWGMHKIWIFSQTKQDFDLRSTKQTERWVWGVRSLCDGGALHIAPTKQGNATFHLFDLRNTQRSAIYILASKHYHRWETLEQERKSRDRTRTQEQTSLTREASNLFYQPFSVVWLLCRPLLIICSSAFLYKQKTTKWWGYLKRKNIFLILYYFISKQYYIKSFVERR